MLAHRPVISSASEFPVQLPLRVRRVIADCHPRSRNHEVLPSSGGESRQLLDKHSFLVSKNLPSDSWGRVINMTIHYEKWSRHCSISMAVETVIESKFRCFSITSIAKSCNMVDSVL